jgi:hypothetical protein
MKKIQKKEKKIQKKIQKKRKRKGAETANRNTIPRGTTPRTVCHTYIRLLAFTVVRSAIEGIGAPIRSDTQRTWMEDRR